MAVGAMLQEERFGYVSAADKAFVCAFVERMAALGYDFGDTIGSGYCWAPYMLVFTRSGVKNKNVVARIYLRDTGIILRLYFSDIDRRRAYIEAAPPHIKQVFVGDFGACQHCHNEKNGACKFRKTYTIDGRFIEKCNGNTFYFARPELAAMDDYLALFGEFYPAKTPAVR